MWLAKFLDSKVSIFLLVLETCVNFDISEGEEKGISVGVDWCL